MREMCPFSIYDRSLSLEPGKVENHKHRFHQILPAKRNTYPYMGNWKNHTLVAGNPGTGTGLDIFDFLRITAIEVNG
jgi:hypothetical protein